MQSRSPRGSCFETRYVRWPTSVKAKLFSSRQNFLSHGKTLFPKAKLSFLRQKFLSQGKTFCLKTKLFSQFFLKAKLLCQGKTFFPKAKLSFSSQTFLSQNKTFFLKAKLSFPRQNFFVKAKLSFSRQNFHSQDKTFFLKTKLSFSRQNSVRREPKETNSMLKGPKIPKVIIILSVTRYKDGWHEYHKRDVLGCSGNLLT